MSDEEWEIAQKVTKRTAAMYNPVNHVPPSQVKTTDIITVVNLYLGFTIEHEDHTRLLMIEEVLVDRSKYLKKLIETSELYEAERVVDLDSD
jgi:hypothetical protein